MQAVSPRHHYMVCLSDMGNQSVNKVTYRALSGTTTTMVQQQHQQQLLIGTVPSFRMYNKGTVPTFKIHDVVTVLARARGGATISAEQHYRR